MSEIAAASDLNIPSWINDAARAGHHDEQYRQQRTVTRQHNKLQTKKHLAVAVGALALSIVLVVHAATNKVDSQASSKQSDLDLSHLQTVTATYDASNIGVETESDLTKPYTFYDLGNGNTVNFSSEVSAKINQYANKYNLDEKFIAAAVMQESRGNPSAKSTDGFNSFGLLQPSLNYHIYRYASYLEKAGLLQEITFKPAKNITESDNTALFAKFQNLPDNWKSKQDIIRVFCSPDANLDVGCSYMRECSDQAKSRYPDLNKSELLAVTVTAYNGGSDKISAMYELIKNGKSSDTPGFTNAREHTRKVMALYAQK